MVRDGIENKARQRRAPALQRGGESDEAVAAVAEEAEEAEISQDLQLLADFGADVAIGGMQARELGV